MFDRCLGNDFESVAALWMCAKRFKTLNICTTAVLWLIWKLRHSLCFQGNQWCGMQAVFYRCAKLTRRWGGNQSDPRPDRGCLPCMTVDSLSCSATIKGGHARARDPMFTIPTVPPQTLATQSDREGAEARGTSHYASDHRLLTVTATTTMLSSSSAQGTSM
jgi:hypothetical protein